MSNIAKRLTGLSEKELFGTNFRSAYNSDDACCPHGILVRQSTRCYADYLVGTGDLNAKREKLRQHTPKALR
ncbi:hypothetical protein SAMN02745119_00238 [Trichlorobacter thiogenes]|uniref:Uncharacterized protein n=1 Tax=Trichlorobacter thiogenes TaxID=115783 RepID=A0A1T4K0V8_9BACT|nr:hypothetical protein SAMN02745119_00238 [Trichlorobacter thiogenes]